MGNIPIGTNLGNIGQLYRPTGFYLIEVDEEWHLFIVSTVGNSLSRIDFGTSLLNTPTGVNLGDGSGLFDLPRDLVITKICDNYFGLLANRTNGEIVLLDFGNDIQNNFFGVSYGSFDGVVYPHAITSFRVSSGNVSFFIVDVESAKLNRLSFDTSVGTIFCGSAIDEVEISYFQPGEYALQLITDEGTPGQNSFCKNIVVIPSPDLNIGSDTILCFGETIELESSSSQTIWQGEVESDIYEVEEEGIIYASLSEGQCTTMDTLEVVFEDCESCFQLPNVFTPDGDMNNDEFRAIINCNVEIIDYQITIFNRWGQKVFSSNNVLTAWNGGYKDSSCPSDVYVWKLFFSYKKSGQVFEKIDSGDITLIR